MQDKANKDLYDLISALSGTSDFTTAENAHLLALANRRMYEAYNRTPYWARYLISAEPRTIQNQICPFTQDGYYLFGAGTDGVNGLYKLNGAENGQSAYTHYETTDISATAIENGTVYQIEYAGSSDFTSVGAGNNNAGTIFTASASTTGTGKVKTAAFSLIRNSGNSAWIIIEGFPNATETAYYSLSSTSITETGWLIGTSPSAKANAPRVRDLSEIGEFVRIHRNQAFLNMSSVEYEFGVQSDGAHILNAVSAKEGQVWVTYKKPITLLTSLDIDGAASLTQVPQEFFYYMAHATYADFLRMDGQHNKASFEEQIAENYLGEEMDNPQQVANNNTIGKRFRTHVSQQSR
tara:strand:- start:2151 stop:3203 length:1053 start_codon:yes stop_codon:yes gene_type:complete